IDDVAPFSKESPEEDYLRNNSSYIAPDGKHLAGGIVRLLLGMMANLVLVGLLVYVISRPIGWLIATSYLHPALAHASTAPIVIRPAMWWSIGGAAGAALVLALFSVAHRWSMVKNQQAATGAARGAAVLACVLFV